MASDDVEELNAVLSTVAEKVPELIRALRASVFSAEAGTDFGEAIGNFYKALVDKGIPEEKALELTSNYLDTFRNIGQLLQMGNKI